MNKRSQGSPANAAIGSSSGLSAIIARTPILNTAAPAELLIQIDITAHLIPDLRSHGINRSASAPLETQLAWRLPMADSRPAAAVRLSIRHGSNDTVWRHREVENARAAGIVDGIADRRCTAAHP